MFCNLRFTFSICYYHSSTLIVWQAVLVAMPPPLQDNNIFVFIRQVAVLFRHIGYLRHQQQVTF